MTGMADLKCYHEDEDTYGKFNIECRFCQIHPGEHYPDESWDDISDFPICSIHQDSFPKPCKYHITKDELKELMDAFYGYI